MRQVAYYKGCLASLSAKELDTSTRALAPQVGLELIELESVTCCGAGDIHEAGRLLPPPECADPRVRGGDGRGHADDGLQRLHAQPATGEPRAQARRALLERVNTSLLSVGAPAYSGGVEVLHFLWLVAAGDGYELLKTAAHKGLKGLKIAPFYGCQILRPSKLLGFEDPGQAGVARADHRGLRRGADRLSGEDQVLRLSDHPGPRGGGACRAHPANRAGDAGGRGRDGDALPALPPLARRQLKLREQTGKDFQMPVLHLSQLIGVAAGLDGSDLRFRRHVVSVDPVTDKLAV